MTCFGGFIQFSFEGLRENTIRTQLGHIQIYAEGYGENRISNPASALIVNPEEVSKPVAALPGVATVTHRLSFSGLGGAGDAIANMSVIGVDLESEQYFSDFEILVEGRRLRVGDTEAGLIGEELQKGLGVEIGDWVTVLTNSLDGIINTIDFQVTGIVRTGSKEYDSVFVKIPIELAQRARETTKVERIIVLLERTESLPDIEPKIIKILSGSDRNFEIRRWNDLAGFYESVVSLYTGIFKVFAGIIGVVVMFSVANTMTMAVFERAGEIGALRAIGVRGSTLIKMFLLEGIVIGLLGSVLGILLSWLTVGAVKVAGGIPMPPPPGMSLGYQAYFNVTDDILLKAFLVVMFSTLLSSIYPAVSASRVKIVDALRKS